MFSRLETWSMASVACRARRNRALGSKGKGYRTVEFEGFEILVGKADQDNDRLTFGIAGPRDFWLHVAGPAGSHVIVRNPFGLAELPRPVAERAAQLAAWHSKARGARGKVEVHLCRVADVRKPKGLAPGEVLLKRWDAVRVYPRGLDEPGEG
jgi:predicted ribosome quality control (RQC) complex YloA/Tae2 family protein